MPADIASDETVRAETGRSWSEWYAVLDDWGGHDRTPPDIARHLEEEHGVARPWNHHVAMNYGRLIDRRRTSQRRDVHGTSIQRTVDAGVEEVRAFFLDEKQRKRWLRAVADARHSEDFRRVADESWERIEAADKDRLRYQVQSCGGDAGSSLDIRFAPRGEGRTQVSLQHEGLASSAERVVMRAGWSEALDALVAHFASG